MKGTIFELRKKVLKVGKEDSAELKVVGRMKGFVRLQEKEMIPIYNRK